MNNMAQAVWVEALKARRSKLPLFSGLGISLVPLVGGFFMFVLRDPELARRAGLISAKAQLTMGVADWPSYLNFLCLAIAVGGLILFGFIVSWVFGREYSDRTLKDLLALPTGRSSIVLAKLVMVIGWSAALTVMMYLIGLGVGAAIGLPQTSIQVLFQGTLRFTITTMLTIALVMPVAFFASVGHGYLPPLGVMMLAIFMAQVVAVAGWGEYFPWAIPGLYAQGENLGPVSYGIVVLTSALGIAGTFAWWELADQTH